MPDRAVLSPPAALPQADKARWVSGRRLRVLLGTAGVSFMIVLDSNIVAVSLPVIARDLNALFADIEWVVSAYVLTFAALLMPSGALADRYGRRRVLLSGLALFTLASLLCGLAPTAFVLNLARALQGVGAALQLSAALAVLGHEFRGAERSRAFAVWGTVMGVGIAAGPIVGGLITSAFGWRWAFLINVPVGVALLVLVTRNVIESRDPQAGRLDIAGMVFFGTGLFFLVWALIGAGANGWASKATALRLGAGAVLMVLFVVAERLQRRPMVDFALFRRPTFLGSGVAMLGFAMAAQVMMTYLPLYLQNAFGFSAAVAGLGMLPFALPNFYFPRVAARLSLRLSGRAILTGGLVTVALGNLATAIAAAAHVPYAVVAAGMLITGAGAGILNSETAKVSMSVVPPERGGMASGISATLRFVGLVSAITGLGAVLASVTQNRFAATRAASVVAPGGDTSALHAFVSRVTAGDVVGAVAPLPAAMRDGLVQAARDSFASGFATALFVAAAVAAVAALLTFRLISAIETAPIRLEPVHPPDVPE